MWSRTRRLLLTTIGLLIGLVALIIGLTMFAQGSQTESLGLAIAIGAFALSASALYLAATGVWGGWSPVRAPDARIRSIRVALVWVALIGSYMCLGLPLVTPNAMTVWEWESFLALVGLVAISIYGLVAIRRRPRRIAVLLSVAAAYALLMLLNFAGTLLSGALDRYSGPAAALSLFFAMSMAVAVVIACWLTWPLDGELRDRAI